MCGLLDLAILEKVDFDHLVYSLPSIQPVLLLF